MRTARLAKREILVLGILALLMAGAFIFPWSTVKEIMTRNKDGGYAFARIRQELNRDGASAPGWGAPTDYAAQTRYSPESGKLEVTLSHKHDSPVSGLRLRADFNNTGSGAKSSAWLRHEGNGRYSAEGMTLPKGDWLMSLSGSHHAGPLFRLEQAVEID